MNKINLADYLCQEIRLDTPTLLYQDGAHAIYWLGNLEETAFRCNVYLIIDQDQAIIVDPGNRSQFESVKQRVMQIVDPGKLSGMILCHQDPDVAASMVDWLDLNPDMLVMTSPRTNVLLPHVGKGDYQYYDTSENSHFALPSGSELRFIEAPLLHFPGAFTTYDVLSKFLFSGDIWAALDLDWQLVVADFEAHVPQLDLFNIDYMSSNIAARGFVRRLDGAEIGAILTQHGSIIDRADVQAALDYLENLQCGVDLIYADI